MSPQKKVDHGHLVKSSSQEKKRNRSVKSSSKENRPKSTSKNSPPSIFPQTSSGWETLKPESPQCTTREKLKNSRRTKVRQNAVFKAFFVFSFLLI